MNLHFAFSIFQVNEKQGKHMYHHQHTFLWKHIKPTLSGKISAEVSAPTIQIQAKGADSFFFFFFAFWEFVVKFS